MFAKENTRMTTARPAKARDEGQWALWLLLHDPETVKQGVAQLAAKYRKVGGQMDREYMTKFASSVMNRITRERTN